MAHTGFKPGVAQRGGVGTLPDCWWLKPQTPVPAFLSAHDLHAPDGATEYHGPVVESGVVAPQTSSSGGAQIEGSMVEDPDAGLVEATGRGDRQAAARLVARHLPRMTALARRMLGNEAEADDVAQDVFLKVWTHARRWQPGAAKFETWLHRVAINACYDRLRKKKPQPLDDAGDPPDPSPDAESLLQRTETARAVEAAIAALPERQRAAITLCHYQGLGNIEAAQVMDVSVEALESLLSRGRRTLKDRLRPLADTQATETRAAAR